MNPILLVTYRRWEQVLELPPAVRTLILHDHDECAGPGTRFEPRVVARLVDEAVARQPGLALDIIIVSPAQLSEPVDYSALDEFVRDGFRVISQNVPEGKGSVTREMVDCDQHMPGSAC